MIKFWNYYICYYLIGFDGVVCCSGFSSSTGTGSLINLSKESTLRFNFLSFLKIFSEFFKFCKPLIVENRLFWRFFVLTWFSLIEKYEINDKLLYFTRFLLRNSHSLSSFYSLYSSLSCSFPWFHHISFSKYQKFI